jgi:uncharacterized protein YjbI with pentapeptide repeats
MRGANFSQANLFCAEVTQTQFDGAVFQETCLYGTPLADI